MPGTWSHLTVQDVEELGLVGREDLEKDVEAPGGDDQVYACADLLELSGHLADVGVHMMPTIARWRMPSMAGSVTATICMTPALTSLLTLCRVAASLSPTNGASLVNGIRPSFWSSRMRVLSVSSRSGTSCITGLLPPTPPSTDCSPYPPLKATDHVAVFACSTLSVRNTGLDPRIPTSEDWSNTTDGGDDEHRHMGPRGSPGRSSAGVLVRPRLTLRIRHPSVKATSPPT